MSIETEGDTSSIPGIQEMEVLPEVPEHGDKWLTQGWMVPSKGDAHTGVEEMVRGIS